MKRVGVLIFLAVVSLSNAVSPTVPPPTPLDCNDTSTVSEAGLVLDQINEAQTNGFILQPHRVVAAYLQKKPHGGCMFYLTVDVLETKCSVLSTKTWRDCTEELSYHELLFGECKAIMHKPSYSRKLELKSYNCTLSPVPKAVIHKMCPDCPTALTDSNQKYREIADKLIDIFNKESNHTHYFKVFHVERVRYQWVFAPSYFEEITIKETDCRKTQTNVVLSKCNFLGDREAKVGLCSGNTYIHHEVGEKSSVSCELYQPKDHHLHGHGHCKCPNEKENVNAQDGHHDVPVQNNQQPENQGAEHKLGCKGCPVHFCRPYPHHHKHVQGQNHTSSENHASSSEKHIDKKQNGTNKPEGKIETIYLEENNILPVLTIAHQVPGFSEFPDSSSPLETCPGDPKQNLPMISKYYPDERQKKGGN